MARCSFARSSGRSLSTSMSSSSSTGSFSYRRSNASAATLACSGVSLMGSGRSSSSSGLGSLPAALTDKGWRAAREARRPARWENRARLAGTRSAATVATLIVCTVRRGRAGWKWGRGKVFVRLTVDLRCRCGDQMPLASECFWRSFAESTQSLRRVYIDATTRILPLLYSPSSHPQLHPPRLSPPPWSSFAWARRGPSLCPNPEARAARE